MFHIAKIQLCFHCNHSKLYVAGNVISLGNARPESIDLSLSVHTHLLSDVLKISDLHILHKSNEKKPDAIQLVNGIMEIPVLFHSL